MHWLEMPFYYFVPNAFHWIRNVRIFLSKGYMFAVCKWYGLGEGLIKHVIRTRDLVEA